MMQRSMGKAVQMPPGMPYAAPVRCCRGGDVGGVRSFAGYLGVALVFV